MTGKQLKDLRKSLKEAILALCDLTFTIDEILKEMDKGEE